jgi:GTP-binding protein
MSADPPRIALVGRPNVGKSTLFNRLVGKRIAIVDDTPGVTRDRRIATTSMLGMPIEIVDTPGFEDVADESLEARMRQQTEAAVREADLCLFVIDARVGVTADDREFARVLRRLARNVLLLANKAEGNAGDTGIAEAWGLGFGEPIGLSAEHGDGIAELQSALLPLLDAGQDQAGEDGDLADTEPGFDPETVYVDDPTRPITVAVIGRPNAGKSTLVNALLGEDRMLTGPEAGITRDSISIAWSWRGRPFRLVDTAGMRRKARVVEKLEGLSVGDTLRAIRFADVCVLLMDQGEAFEKQDLQIADLVLREGRALVAAISKWDAASDPNARARHLRERAATLLPQARGLPVVTLSAIGGSGLDALMTTIVRVHTDWNTRVKTGDLNGWLREAIERHPPPAVEGRPLRPKYIAQIKARPPTFVLMCARGSQMPEAYRRYLVNGIRHAFDMPGVPIRLILREPKGRRRFAPPSEAPR